jgi:hypothetical protein
MAVVGMRRRGIGARSCRLVAEGASAATPKLLGAAAGGGVLPQQGFAPKAWSSRLASCTRRVKKF